MFQDNFDSPKKNRDFLSSSIGQNPSHPPKKKKKCTQPLDQTRCLNIFKLLVAALPSIVFGVFTVIFTIQQDLSARATREQDQRQADEISRRIIFKDYIDDMRAILLDENFQQNINKSLLHIRVQTLTALKNLDATRKADVILFLYENHLLRHDRPPNVDLHGADLTGIRFTKSSTEACNMSFLYLPGVFAENIVFGNCALPMSVFDDALLVGAQFHSCALIGSRFIHANLTRSQFHGNHLLGANFASASLIQSFFKGGFVQKANFTNADLYQSTITDDMLAPPRSKRLPPNIFLNTRFPNGSFSAVKIDNLVSHGEANSECDKNQSSSWLRMTLDTDDLSRNLLNDLEANIVRFNDQCFYRVDREYIVYEMIAVQRYSLLIDLEPMMVNISAFVGMKNRNHQDDMSIFIHFLEGEGSTEFTNSLETTIKEPFFFQHHWAIQQIPPGTRYFIVWFECSVVNDEDQFGLFDQVKLSIFKKNNLTNIHSESIKIK